VIVLKSIAVAFGAIFVVGAMELFAQAINYAIKKMVGGE